MGIKNGFKRVNCIDEEKSVQLYYEFYEYEQGLPGELTSVKCEEELSCEAFKANNLRCKTLNRFQEQYKRRQP